MRNFVNLLNEDFRGCLLRVFQKIRISLLKYVYTIYVKIKASVYGIKLGSNCIFHGNVLFSRYFSSEIKIGDGCSFVSHSYLNYRGINHRCILQTGERGAFIHIGNNCGFSGVSIVASKGVTIGNNVLVGANVVIGDREDHLERYPVLPVPVVIEDNVWIGMNCIILKGVHIGENSIIGAGSVVTKDIPANCIAAGVPCKFIKEKK